MAIRQLADCLTKKYSLQKHLFRVLYYMNKRYRITPTLYLLRDEANVRFHVKSDDYFGTIATVLDLIKQQIKKDSRPDAAVLNKTLKNLKDDLMFLQNNYEIKRRPQIRPRIKNRNSKPKGKLKSQ